MPPAEFLRFAWGLSTRSPFLHCAVNEAERILREMFDRAGLNGYEPQTPIYEPQTPIELGRPLGTTVPDFFFADPEGEEPGICVYLDGMSTHLHGNPETAERDRHIREQLRSMGYQVIVAS